MDDRLVVLGPDASSGYVVGVRSPDGSWTSVDLDDLRLPSDGVMTQLYTGKLTAGPTGISLIATVSVDPIAEVGGVDVTRNGITMHAADWQGNVTFLDESGVELGRVAGGQPSGLVEQDEVAGGYRVRRTAGGAVVATFVYDDISQAIDGSAVETQRPFVIHSDDGVNWSREALTDLAGEPVQSTSGIRLTDTQIIVAANLEGQANPNGTPKQVLLIGTPNS
ncbi:MAG: hypothetical protein HZB15_11125 [Actinobacteria bacterium]|nr:hypothetical protein [Actinomycetota bacterium]